MAHARICKHCNQPFATNRKHAQYCSDAHRWQAAKERARAVENEEPMKRKLTGKGCRAKGARVENEICHMIANITGDQVKRNLDQTRDGGADIHWGPFMFEVKARQTVSMPAWQEQVRKAAQGTNFIPSVVWKRNGEEPWVALPFADFIKMFDDMRKALMILSQGPGHG